MILAVLRVLYSLLYTDFIQSEHTNVKILKYADIMAIVDLLDFKTDASFYFDTVDNFLEKGRSKEMILSFSRTFAIDNYLFINNSVIDKVEHFKYFGTTFSNSV